MGAPKKAMTIIRITNAVTMDLFPLKEFYKGMFTSQQIAKHYCAITYWNDNLQYPYRHFKKGDYRTCSIIY